MSDFEEGEVASDDVDDDEDDRDSDTAPYNPLHRPLPPSSSVAGGSNVDESGDSRPSSSFASLSAAVATRPRSSTNSSMMVNIGDMDGLEDNLQDLDSSRGSGSVTVGGGGGGSSRAQRIIDSDSEGLLDDSSSEDDSSDGEKKGLAGAEYPRKKKLIRLDKRPEESPSGSSSHTSSVANGGSIFNTLAAKFQEDRALQGLPTRKANNVWGSILQEESLTAEMTGIGVGRSLKDLNSDRGAETYDYVLAQEHENERRLEKERKEKEREEKGLDEDLQKYWSKEDSNAGAEKMETGASDDRRNVAIQAGKKRSVKDRLGSRRDHSRPEQRFGDLDNMSIPPPGVSRTIADIDQETKVVGSDVELGREIATKLSEPKSELMVGVIDIVGRQVAMELFERTQRLELDGGMMIKCGERRRTPGGVFLQLLRDSAKEDSRIDEEKIRHFFAQSNRPPQNRRNKKPQTGKFKSDLALFKKLSEERKKKQQKEEEATAKDEMDFDDMRKEYEEEEELKPLPDILTSISQRIRQQQQAPVTVPKGEELEDDKQLVAFVEPGAPPNSVERVDERVMGTYDDDFLSHEGDDIELF